VALRPKRQSGDPGRRSRGIRNGVKYLIVLAT